MWTSGLSAEDVPRKYCSNESRKFQDPSSGKFHMLCEFLGEASVNVTEADLFVWSRSDLSTARVTTFSRGSSSDGWVPWFHGGNLAKRTVVIYLIASIAPSAEPVVVAGDAGLICLFGYGHRRGLWQLAASTTCWPFGRLGRASCGLEIVQSCRPDSQSHPSSLVCRGYQPKEVLVEFNMYRW